MADDDNLGLRLAWAQTVGTFVGLLAIGLAVVALLIERVRRVQAADERRFTSEDSALGCFRAKSVSRWSSLWGDTTETLRLPTVAGLIEVGDRGGWTSSALDFMIENHPKETWVKLYESIMTSIACNAGVLEKDWRGEEEPVLTFLGRIEGNIIGSTMSRACGRPVKVPISPRLGSCSVYNDNWSRLRVKTRIRASQASSPLPPLSHHGAGNEDFLA